MMAQAHTGDISCFNVSLALIVYTMIPRVARARTLYPARRKKPNATITKEVIRYEESCNIAGRDVEISRYAVEVWL